MSRPASLNGIRGRLILLLLIVLGSVLLGEAVVFYQRYETRKAEEWQANLELARALGKNFETFVQDLVHSQLMLGAALTVSQSMTVQDRNRILDTFQAEHPAVRSAYWTNPEGSIVGANRRIRDFVGVNIADRSYVREIIIEGRNWAVSELYVGRATEKLGFAISRGIRDEQGKLLGIVVAAIEPDRLDGVLGIGRSEDGGVSLIDHKGMHVYRYPPTEYTAAQRNWRQAYPMITEALNGKDVLARVTSELTGKTRLVAFTPVSSIGWVAAASRAEEDVLTAITSALRLQVGIVLVVTMVGFGAALALARPIATALIGLRTQALALGRGERETLAPVSGPMELHDLATVFNQMAAAVQSREGALRESQERYRSLFNGMTEGFALHEIITDDADRPVDYRFLDINPAFERLTGLKREDVLDRRLLEVLPNSDPYWVEAYGKVALTGEPTRLENFSTPLNRWYEAFAYQPAPRQFAAIFADVTARKQAETALQHVNDELEQRVQERTVELSVAVATLREQAAHLQALARELTLAEQRERQRLAELLHDGLQQLLVSAKLRVSLLARADPGGIADGWRDVTGLLDDALAASRTLTGELSPPILRTGGLVAGLEWLVRWVDEKHQLAVEFDADPLAVPDSEAMTLLLFQSVRELLFNVVKHAQVRAARVEVRRQDGHLQIVVSDQGVGFDPATHSTIGTGGLGHSSIRQRLEFLGGCVAIASAPGQGCRITLAAPLQSRATGPPAPVIGPSLPSRLHGAKIRVLLVDDHAVVRHALAQMLGAEADLEVVGEAADGKAAVERTHELQPDVVLMDINMPVMNGIEATQQIHADCPGVGVIGLSMFGAAEQTAALQSAGAVGYVSKIAPVEELLAAIRRAR